MTERGYLGMTPDEFQRAYHEYEALTLSQAEAEARKVNAGALGFTVRPVLLMGRYALMLESAADTIEPLLAKRDSMTGSDLPPKPGGTPGWGGVVHVRCTECGESTDMWLEEARRWPDPFVCRKCRELKR